MLGKQEREEKPRRAGKPGLAAAEPQPRWWPRATAPQLQRDEDTASNVPTPGSSWVPSGKQHRSGSRAMPAPPTGRKEVRDGGAGAPPCQQPAPVLPFQGHTPGIREPRHNPEGSQPWQPLCTPGAASGSTHWCPRCHRAAPPGDSRSQPPRTHQPPLLLHLRADPAASRDPLILGSPCQGGRLREPLSQQSSISALPQAPDVPGHPRSPAGQGAKGTPHSLHTGIHLGANPGCSRVGNMGCSRPVLHSPELQQGLVG